MNEIFYLGATITVIISFINWKVDETKFNEKCFWITVVIYIFSMLAVILGGVKL